MWDVLAIAVVERSWGGKGAGCCGRPGWCPLPMPASVNVDSAQGSNIGFCAHVAPSHQPQGAMVVRASALSTTCTAPNQGSGKVLPPAGFRAC